MRGREGGREVSREGQGRSHRPASATCSQSMGNSATLHSICAISVFCLHFHRFCGVHGSAGTSGVMGDVLVYKARLLGLGDRHARP